MAYMNQEKKAKIASKIKPLLKQYGIKGSLSVRNHSTIILTIKSGPIDFIQNYNNTVKSKPGYREAVGNMDVNQYWYHEHFTGKAKEFLDKAVDAMMSADWFDESDSMTDYFHVAYYFNINIGKWNKDYEVAA